MPGSGGSDSGVACGVDVVIKRKRRTPSVAREVAMAAGTNKSEWLKFEGEIYQKGGAHKIAHHRDEYEIYARLHHSVTFEQANTILQQP